MILPHSPPLTYTLAAAPGGRRAVFNTMRLMREIVRRSKVSPAVHQAAQNIIFLQPERDRFGEACAIYEWVRNSVRYIPDVYGVETLTTPEKVLIRRTGDCDDQTMLLCALFEAVGFPTRFVMAGYVEGEDYAHIYCQVFVNGEWIDCDPTEPQSFGWAPPDPVKMFIEAV